MSKKGGLGLEVSSSRKRTSSDHNPIQTPLSDIRATTRGGGSLQSVSTPATTTEYPHLQGATGTASSQTDDSLTASISQQTRTQQLLASPSTPRQVIAVSASKGPAAFFNLARKFLATDEVCDLSALEGAIVSAVDAAHLLERSKLATIVRIQTSYVAVEPKRKSQQQTTNVDVSTNVASAPTTSSKGVTNSQQQTSGRLLGAKKAQGRSKGTPLRRARIIITVQRTEAYTLWLTENPHHLAGDGDEDIDVASTQANATAKSENVGTKKPRSYIN